MFSAISVGFLSRICTIIIRFISLPLILNVLTKERYGLWLVILSIVGWLGMSDLGIPSALQNRIIYLYAHNYTERARTLIAYGIKFLWVIGFCAFLIGGVLSYIIPLNNWFSIDNKLIDEFRLSLQLCLFSFSIGLPSRLGNVIYNSHGRLSQQPLYELSSSIVSFTLLLIVIYFNWSSLISLAFCNLAGLTAGNLLGTVLALKQFNYKIVEAPPKSEDKKAILTKGSFFFLATIGELLILQSDAILIGIVLGVSKVPQYIIPATLFINFIQLQNIWLRPLWPLLTKVYAQENFKTLKNLLRKYLYGSIITSILFGIFLITYGNLFIKFWSHGTTELSFIMGIGLGLYTLIACVDNLLATFLNALGKIEFRFSYSLFFGLAKVFSGWLVLSNFKNALDWLPFTYAIIMLLCSIPFALSKIHKIIYLKENI